MVHMALTSLGYEPIPYMEDQGDHYGLGRLISAHSGDQQCLDLAKEWFHRCTHTHGEACALKDCEELPKRLVYVPPDPNDRLRVCITAGRRGQYAALSYCWGQGTRFQSTRSTINERIAGFYPNALPQSLRDAVDVTRHLGLRYIWIDSLCIIQADEVDWNTESAKMATVYGGAAVTICADLSQNTDQGFLQPRRAPVSHCFGPNGKYCLQLMSQDWDHMCAQPLYERGWAFQERLLARRTLHFLDDQIAWECNTTLYREQFRYRQLHGEDHFIKKQLAPWYHQGSCPAPPRHPYGIWFDLDLRICRWNAVIQEIAVRKFTVETDRLPAISGLASAIKTPEMGTYLAGIWEGDPFKSMLWYVRFPADQEKYRRKYMAPSWSWVWTKHQIMWPYLAFTPDRPADQIDKWETWSKKFGPKLLKHHVKLKSQDPHGEVLSGTYLIMSGYCRNIYIAEHPGTTYDEWKWWGENPCEAGSYIHLDQRNNGRAIASSFSLQELQTRHPEISTESIRKCLCVQVARERRQEDHFPKVVALLLEPAKVDGEPGFRRCGVLLFDLLDGSADFWKRKELKLF